MAYRDNPTKDMVVGSNKPSNIFCRMFGHKHTLNLEQDSINRVGKAYGIKEYVFAFHTICVRCGTPYLQGIPLTAAMYPYEEDFKYFYLKRPIHWIKRLNTKFWNWIWFRAHIKDTNQIYFDKFETFTSFDKLYEFLNTNDLIVKKPWHQSYNWLRFDLDKEHFAVCTKTLQVVNLNDQELD
jgi:hypothetical protein